MGLFLLIIRLTQRVLHLTVSFEKEAKTLYREFLSSLEEQEVEYVIDDYLTDLEGIRKVSTRCGSNISCFAVRGREHDNPVTYLLSLNGTSPHMCPSEEENIELEEESDLRFAAANLVSVVLAMRTVAGKDVEELPLDTHFILLGSEPTKYGRQGFDANSLRDAIVDKNEDIGHGAHLVIVESTGLTLCNVQKGCIIFRLDIKGQMHHPSLSWLGGNPWESLMRFNGAARDIVKTEHDLYPVELGKATSLILSRFLVGLPAIITIQIKTNQVRQPGDCVSVEGEYYVSTPPEFSHIDVKGKLINALPTIARETGCEVRIDEVFEEEPFREDPNSLIVKATSNAFARLTGYEPVSEWLPFPVSARSFRLTGFAEDLVVFGPADLNLAQTQNEDSIVGEAVLASKILAQTPYELATLAEERRSFGMVT